MGEKASTGDWVVEEKGKKAKWQNVESCKIK